MRDVIPDYVGSGVIRVALMQPARSPHVRLCLRLLPDLRSPARRRSCPAADVSRCSKLQSLFDHLVGERH